MHIYLDNIIFFLQRSGGISVYWSELQKRILEKEGERAHIIEIDGYQKNIFRKTLDINPRLIRLESHWLSRFLRYLPVYLPVSEKVLFHSSYYRFSLQKKVRNVVTVHDFTYEKFRKGPAKWIHTAQKFFAIKKADGIICVSENTKKDLLEYLPQIHLKKIAVIHNGVSEDFYPLSDTSPVSLRNAPNKPFVLFVGDRKSVHKNFDMAVEILHRTEGLWLVMVGNPLSKVESVLLEQKLPERYRYFSRISAAELNVLYNRAFCLLYPSSYEGFGIPVVEAMKAGCPVVSTKTSSITEVAGDAGLLVDCIEVECFLEKIAMLNDVRVRDMYRQKGLVNAEQFGWDRCFDQTMTFYHDVFER
ncbi:glycosyltransferase family 4 protein [bacterium AH-315-E07]|nr:glycosyltransferase family 4 protein [bacterium AH-315-E07]